jgi:hypothetical protein
VAGRQGVLAGEAGMALVVLGTHRTSSTSASSRRWWSSPWQVQTVAGTVEQRPVRSASP